ncbi:tyrosine-protein phosphatase [Paraflavitalea speifideaquila]|uniref:tyrosine-protein phosphatase n=1 Tax=Paraflavitalea speifideaquila TaxID=3076558 RepID=UPI0028EBCBF3|nr:tyrosine-protein phosphatase [Paraflavitalea speifideiaquila]
MERPVSPYYSDRYKPLFQKLLALPDTAAILYHCTGGRDRTGMASALFLYALGVPESTIEADFTASNIYLVPMHIRMYQGISQGMGLDMATVKRKWNCARNSSIFSLALLKVNMAR